MTKGTITFEEHHAHKDYLYSNAPVSIPATLVREAINALDDLGCKSGIQEDMKKCLILALPT